MNCGHWRLTRLWLCARHKAPYTCPRSTASTLRLHGICTTCTGSKYFDHRDEAAAASNNSYHRQRSSLYVALAGSGIANRKPHMFIHQAADFLSSAGQARAQRRRSGKRCWTDYVTQRGAGVGGKSDWVESRVVGMAHAQKRRECWRKTGLLVCCSLASVGFIYAQRAGSAGRQSPAPTSSRWRKRVFSRCSTEDTARLGRRSEVSACERMGRLSARPPRRSNPIRTRSLIRRGGKPRQFPIKARVPAYRIQQRHSIPAASNCPISNGP